MKSITRSVCLVLLVSMMGIPLKINAQPYKFTIEVAGGATQYLGPGEIKGQLDSKSALNLSLGLRWNLSNKTSIRTSI